MVVVVVVSGAESNFIVQLESGFHLDWIELSWSVLDRQVLDEKYWNPTQGSCIDPIYEATQTVTHPSTNATNAT